MNGRDLKNYIYENNLIPQILESIGCYHIKFHGKYWTCSNHDGNNIKAVSIYNTEYINVVNYTRDITSGGKLPSDLISLVCFNKQLSPFEGIKFICNEIGIDYYHNFEDELPESLKITKLIYDLQESNLDNDEEKPLKPISPTILNYYKPYVNDMFLKDNISYETQREFGIAYDPESNRIAIPIYSEIGDLIGVKGRLFKENLESWEQKYIYLEPCAKSKILYGLNKTYQFIKNNGFVFVGESEKFVAQLWDVGIYNSVSIGGHQFSSTQIDKLTRLGVDITVCFDKDVSKTDIENECSKFIDGTNVYYLYDKDNLLNEKESPSDDINKFKELNLNYKYKFYR